MEDEFGTLEEEGCTEPRIEFHGAVTTRTGASRVDGRGMEFGTGDCDNEDEDGQEDWTGGLTNTTTGQFGTSYGPRGFVYRTCTRTLTSVLKPARTGGVLGTSSCTVNYERSLIGSSCHCIAGNELIENSTVP